MSCPHGAAQAFANAACVSSSTHLQHPGALVDSGKFRLTNFTHVGWLKRSWRGAMRRMSADGTQAGTECPHPRPRAARRSTDLVLPAPPVSSSSFRERKLQCACVRVRVRGAGGGRGLPGKRFDLLVDSKQITDCLAHIRARALKRTPGISGNCGLGRCVIKAFITCRKGRRSATAELAKVPECTAADGGSCGSVKAARFRSGAGAPVDGRSCWPPVC